MEYLALILALAFFIGIIVWAVRHTKKVNQRKGQFYRDFAQKHGLQHSESKYMLAMLNECSGQIGELQVRVYEKMVGSGKNRQIYSNIEINNNGIPFQFKIGKEHIFSKAGKMMGLKDIEFGDEEFDKQFLMKSKDEEAFKRIMNMNMQSRLKEIKSDLVNAIRNDNSSMSYFHYGPLAKERQFKAFENVFDYMIELTKQRR